MSEVETINVPNAVPSGSVPVVEVTTGIPAAKADAPQKEEIKKEEKPAKKEAVAPKLSKLAQREQAAAAKETEAQAREAKLAEREAKILEAETLTEQLRKNPSKALKKLGLSFDDIASAILHEPAEGEEEEETESETDKRIRLLEEDKAAKEKKAQEEKDAADQSRLDNAVNFLKEQIDKTIAEDEDAYELIRVNGAHDLVYQTMVEYYAKHNVIPDHKDACAGVEAFLEEKARSLITARKVQSMVTPKKEGKTQTSFGRTLSNNGTQIVAGPSKEDTSHLSPEERRKRAVEKLRFI